MMKPLTLILSRKGRGNRCEFVNEDRAELFGFTNEIALAADNWVMISPYGDFSGTAFGARAVQRFHKPDALEMVNEFNTVGSKLARGFKGAPMYVGHPDADDPAIAAEYPDKKAYGWFNELAARDDGLYGKLDASPAGKELINNKHFRFFSPRWHSARAPIARENGVAVYGIRSFASVGLTNRPNIKTVPALPHLNEGTHNKKGPQMKELMAFLLGLLGFNNEAGASEESWPTELLGKVKTGLTTLAEKAKKLTEVETSFANERTAHAATRTRLTTVEGERDTARTEFANERTARINDELAQAIEHNRITGGERDAWMRRLTTDFVNELPNLRKATSGTKTTSRTGGLGDRRKEGDTGADGVQELQELINEEAKTIPVNDPQRHAKAYASAKRKHPAKFAPAAANAAA